MTFALAVPAPLETAQLCEGFDGCVSTVTLYVLPALRAVENVKGPLPLIDKLLELLFCRTRPLPEDPRQSRRWYRSAEAAKEFFRFQFRRCRTVKTLPRTL